MGPQVRDEQARITADVPAGTIVYATAVGSNVVDVDGNRYVDLAAGFGSLLLGHAHPALLRTLQLQAPRLTQALGDVYPSDAKIALLERLARLYPEDHAKVILGSSGADAISAALKTAQLFTGKPGVLAFRGAYHGLSYGPLSACGFRESYREPFLAQLNPHVVFASYPSDARSVDQSLTEAAALLATGSIGAVLVEPILGRGGCIVPPSTFLPELAQLTQRGRALLIADEIWTGLGRSGRLLYSTEQVVPDLICLGKGLGGCLPVSATIGSDRVMQAWRREREVVHTSTFAGAPLGCATALTTLDVLRREQLIERAAEVGERFRSALRALVPDRFTVRGEGLMVGVELGSTPQAASRLQRRLLEHGYIVSTGGTERDVLVLTPALNVAEAQLEGFAACLGILLRSLT